LAYEKGSENFRAPKSADKSRLTARIATSSKAFDQAQVDEFAG
jgi:hypothetical protein